MKNKILLNCIALVALAIPAGVQAQVNPMRPHLEKRGAATQLIVDGKPYLALAGETDNTASSDLAYMDTVWPKVARANLNTVLVGVGWNWVEPVEGKYDFSLVDGILSGARKNNLHVVLLWFGSWKNGLSSFAPAWVKADQQRFPRDLLTNGKSVEVLFTFSDNNLQADTRAYTAFMHHLRQVDSKQHTVVMIQLENEVGLIGDTRDHSPAAEAAFAQPVPRQLMEYLQMNKATLWPELRKLWRPPAAKLPARGRTSSANCPSDRRNFHGVELCALHESSRPRPARMNCRSRCSQIPGCPAHGQAAGRLSVRLPGAARD